MAAVKAMYVCTAKSCGEAFYSRYDLDTHQEDKSHYECVRCRQQFVLGYYLDHHSCSEPVSTSPPSSDTDMPPLIDLREEPDDREVVRTPGMKLLRHSAFPSPLAMRGNLSRRHTTRAAIDKATPSQQRPLLEELVDTLYSNRTSLTSYNEAFQALIHAFKRRSALSS